MLYLHEVHAVMGDHESEYEEAAREAYLGLLPSQPGARLLWYLDSTHGSGEGYKVVTITGFDDARGYDRYLDRVLSGDLSSWMRHADDMRYELVGKLLTDIGDGSQIDLDDVPTSGEHPTSVLRLDLCRPAAGADLVPTVRGLAARIGEPDDLLRLEHTFVPAMGAAEDDSVLLLYRLLDLDAWVQQWFSGAAEWSGGAGALAGMASRESRLLRTSTWSPLT